MIVFPNAKINLGLFITERRNDGYHNLETIFYPVKIEDALEIIPAEKTTISLSGLPVAGTADKNLVQQAFDLLRQDFPDKMKPVAICLHKAIPMGAGMGGGSSNGAFMLRLLDHYFGLGISDEQMISYALTLGSDCPFFIVNKPCFATGRGELLEPLALSLEEYSLQIICPELHISTAVAFKDIRPRQAPVNLRTIGTLPVVEWRDQVFNDFESTVFPLYPVLQQVKSQLYRQGAIYAAMSGTGSAIYGIFPKGEKAGINIDLPFKEFYY